ncbi:MAG: zinc ribbon domain-containing protein [Deltaproteobacteria bacterium]|nr:zinc ribbon domain-containing protein [Deltaproteobacteria bacterium]
MPIYEYQCPECGRFEVMQKINDAPLAECPTCMGAGKRSAVKRLVSLSAFHLKGTGWYKTDYCAKDSNGKSASGHAHKVEVSKEGAKEQQSEDPSGSSKEGNSPPLTKVGEGAKDGGVTASKNSAPA